MKECDNSKIPTSNYNMEHWWNNTETRKLTYLDKSLFKYHVFHHKCHMH
jgi:hypothetical protein